MADADGITGRTHFTGEEMDCHMVQTGSIPRRETELMPGMLQLAGDLGVPHGPGPAERIVGVAVLADYQQTWACPSISSAAEE
jgi:hypothetical protein